MRIITDNTNFTNEYFTSDLVWKKYITTNPIMMNLERFITGDIYETEIENDFWTMLIAVKQSAESQYDQLIKAAQESIALPDKLLLIADTGEKFHGLRNRQWEAMSGNIHLSIFLSPKRAIDNFGAAVMALPSLSIIEALNCIDNIKQKPQIKWVNDIFVGNNKLAGTLAHTQQQGAMLSSIIYGIGLNAKKAPNIEFTVSVPGTTSLLEIVDNQQSYSQSIVFKQLLSFLQKNIELLYDNKSTEIIEEYKKHSMIIGRKVRIYDHTKPDEPEICSGVVDRIGNHLELYINGIEKPVIKGRLMLL